MNNNQYIKKISDDLWELGVKESGILLVHSSFKSLGEVAGGPATVIRGIQLALGDKGTLLMPTLTNKSVDGDENNIFSSKDTPSEVGALTEYFRTMDGVRRSMNPTHSVCGMGRYADELLKSHKNDDTPCGPHSPYKILGEVGGQILFIGCGLNINTSMHAIEEVMQPPYIFTEDIQYKMYNENREKNYSYYKKQAFKDVVPRYDRLEKILPKGEGIRKGRVLGADCYLIEAKEMWKFSKKMMERNPMYFVDVIGE